MMRRVIANRENLARTDLRRDALAIAEAGFAAIQTSAALHRELRVDGETLHIGDHAYPIAGRRIFFVGIGKCAIDAAHEVEHMLGERLTAGIALDVSPIEEHKLHKIVPYIGTHPLPSEENERATESILGLLGMCKEKDLVLMLISGGGSTLLCLHEDPKVCLDEATLFSSLTKAGVTIQEMNTVRKHISRARGGGLAKAAYPAEVVSLIVSDVPGNDIVHVASGPTALDISTITDAQAVLDRHHVTLPKDIVLEETPKESRYFERVTNILFLSNENALVAMKEEGSRRGYAVTVVDDQVAGEARDVGRGIVAKLHEAPARSLCLYAGETTVTLGEKHGEGGRNQEMALASLESLGNDELLLPFASDGHDNSDHAGAIADVTTRTHAEEKDLVPADYLAEHRSYDFFAATGDALQTGYTGSNVSDLIIAIKH